MPLYQFKVHDGVESSPTVSADLADDHAARIEGGRLMSELLREKPFSAYEGLNLSVVVTDASGRMLCSMKTYSST